MNRYAQLRMGRLITGRGSIAYLKELGKKRAAVIYDGRVLDEAGRARLSALIGCDVRFIADIKGEPTFEDVHNAIASLGDFEPELFVAVGGGSVMDAAKAVWLFYEHPELKFEDAFRHFQLPPTAGKAVIAAVPTTSGTGSETTCCAVLTNERTHQKELILGFEIVPEYAVLDPDFTDGLPAVIAAHTGMDALSHAIEAAVCVAASPIIVSMGLGAALDILESLPDSVNAQGERRASARENCHYAAAMAGVAINNCSAGLVHALDQVGPCFGLPHGLVCGVLLPYTTAFHSHHPVYARLAKRLGLADGAALADYLWEFNARVGIAHSFRELGVEESAFLEKLPGFAAAADDSMAARLSPKQPSRAEAEAILRAAYYGEKPER